MKTLSELLENAQFPDTSSPEDLAQYVWRKETKGLMRAAGVPERFLQRLNFDDCRPQKAVFSRCQGLCSGKGAIVALVGPRGTGKTTIAAQLVRARAENEELPPWERQPPYRKTVDLLNRWKPLYSDSGHIDIEELRFRRDEYCRLSLHIIDEIHECEDLKARDRMLTDICDRCYAFKTDVVLISNQTEEQFRKTTNESILSRLEEHGEVIECKWESRRESRREAKG